MNIKFKRMGYGKTQKTALPKYQTPGSAGFDMAAAIPDPVTLLPGGFLKVPLGFAMEIPEGFEVQLRPRSGLAFKQQIVCVFGTIDSDYRGEVCAGLFNFGNFTYTIKPGERVVQAVLKRVRQAAIIEVTELSDTQRGEDGFGSTGVN